MIKFRTVSVMENTFSLAIFFVFAFASLAFGAEIASLPWNSANLETLKGFDKSAIVRFINDWSGGGNTPDAIKPNEILQFRWVDLFGNGEYELATLESAGPCCVFLVIFTKAAKGRGAMQSYDGGGDLHATIRDLNGDGKDELILSKLVVENSGQLKFYWPAVYRPENGKYVEASRDFPKYYDNEVLPQLDQQLSEAQAKVAPGKHNYEYRLAGLIMERDQILRVLGRNPTDGLNHAYQWLNSDDPYLLQDAEVTFKEIGGHKADDAAAQEKRTRALCARHPGTAMCRQPAASRPTADH